MFTFLVTVAYIMIYGLSVGLAYSTLITKFKWNNFRQNDDFPATELASVIWPIVSVVWVVFLLPAKLGIKLCNKFLTRTKTIKPRTF